MRPDNDHINTKKKELDKLNVKKGLYKIFGIIKYYIRKFIRVEFTTTRVIKRKYTVAMNKYAYRIQYQNNYC